MNPYLINGPALISFSGGRTSAYMLHRIVQAHGGELPSDVIPVFCNTGKEREETLRFVHECGTRWGVEVVWLERLPGGGFERVGYNSADRDGAAFASLLSERQMPPNWKQRFCTADLKVRPKMAFAESLGWTQWTNAVGLRADEGHRIPKFFASNEKNDRERLTGGFFDRRDRYAPLAEEVRRQPHFDFDETSEFDVECGDQCETEE